MSGLGIVELLRLLEPHGALLTRTTLSTVVQFFDVLCALKPELERGWSLHDLEPPERLPTNIITFLQAALEIEEDIVDTLWPALRSDIWRTEYNVQLMRTLGERYIPVFLKHGPHHPFVDEDGKATHNLVFHTLGPPTKTCLDPQCEQVVSKGSCLTRDRELDKPVTVPVTVFTHNFGAIPGNAISLYCRKCHTRYYHNYYLHDNASIRTYYEAPPEFVHTAEHVFIESRTCEVFSSMMVNSWTSATNCARIYNTAFASKDVSSTLPLRYSKNLKLDEANVWNGLFLYWLILDSAEQNEHVNLTLNHNAPSQNERLKPALEMRNIRMAGPGQEEWNHACDLCCWVKEEEDGTYRAVRSVVIDGITLGRPCCGVHDCQRPLVSVKDRFCAFHEGHNKLCCAVGCNKDAETGFCTCSNETHRALETWLREENKAMFQLRRRQKRLGVAHPNDAIGKDALQDGARGASGSTQHSDEAIEVDENTFCEGKSTAGNQVKGNFGRRRTHNEEVAVCSCGMILGRVTFFGSEAPNAVREFLKTLFPTQASLPQVIWHDNNCKIQAMLQADRDPSDREYFKFVALPVDVFHFKSKHKESDTFCKNNCNPVLWPELTTSDGKWRFNSSAAEQSNAWMGGFQAMVREMEATRYTFFLDEMVKRRNRILLDELIARGASPYSIPRDVLLATV